MDTPKRRDYRRRVFDQPKRPSFGRWMNILVVLLALGVVMWIWQPWKTADERIQAQAELFQDIAGESQKVEEVAKAPGPPEPFIKSYDDYIAGTSLRVTVFAQTQQEVDDLLHTLKYIVQDTAKIFDRDDPTSPLARVETAKPNTWVKVPQIFADALHRYMLFAKKSGGMCDPTIGLFITKYRFGDGEKDDGYPEKDVRDATKKLTDFRFVNVNTKERKVRISKSGVKLDWLTLARAAILSEVKEKANSAHLTNFIVFAGRDSIAFGKPLNAAGQWRWQIPDPISPVFRRFGQLTQPSGMAVGAAFVSEKGRIVNKYWIHPFVKPTTGLPTRDAVNAIAVAPDPLVAVIAARCALVLGPDVGLQFLRSLHVEGMIDDPEGKRKMTPGFPKVYIPDAKPQMYD